MKKLLVSLFALAALMGQPMPVEAMPVMQGAIKGNLLPGAVQVSQTSVHTSTATQTTYTWTTVNLGATLNRKLALFFTWRGETTAKTFVSATVNGSAGYHILTKTNILNSVALVTSDVASGTTNCTVSLTLSGNATAASLMVMRLETAAYLAPTSVASTIVDAANMSVFVPTNGSVISAGIAQSSSPSAAWTNNTEITDAVISGSTLHTSAAVNVSTEEATRDVSVNVAGTVTDFAAITATFQPAGGKPFIYHARDDLNNTADKASYTFAGVNIGPPADDRKIIFLVGTRSPNGGSRQLSKIYLGSYSGTQSSRQAAVYSQTSAYNMLFIESMAIPGSDADSTATFILDYYGAVYDCNISVVVTYGLSSITAVSAIDDFNSSAAALVQGNLPTVSADGMVIGFTTSYGSANMTVTATYDGGSYTPDDLYLGQYQNFALTLLERQSANTTVIIANTWSSSNPASYAFASFR